MKRFLSVCGLLLACFAVPSAYASTMIVAMPKFEREVIVKKNGAEAEQVVHDSVIAGARNRGWEVVSDENNTLRLKIVVRNRHTVVIDARIIDNAVAIDYVSSENMDYDKGGASARDECAYVATWQCKKDQEHIHINYGHWVRNLLRSARVAAKTL
jgi:hypothetical protein